MEWYNTYSDSKGVQLVFVSSDRDKAGFDEYLADMPWWALDYADRDAKAALSKARYPWL